ncbi:hypothetical protein B0A48_00922, partial [Cryoendolithus antarcticus]
RQRLLGTLMQDFNFAASDAVAVAALIERGITPNRAIRMHRMMVSSGRDEDYVARIVEIMDAGHTEAIALQAIKLEEDDVSPADALSVARVMNGGHSLEVEESLMQLLQLSLPDEQALRAAQLLTLHDLDHPQTYLSPVVYLSTVPSISISLSVIRMPPINFPNDLAPGPSENDSSISLAILNVAVLLAFVLITSHALRVIRDLPGYYRARPLPRHSAPSTPNPPPDTEATISGAQDNAPADEPIEQWEVVGDDWGIIPDSAEVREERREDERLARSTASLVEDTSDTEQGADAPPPAVPSSTTVQGNEAPKQLEIAILSEQFPGSAQNMPQAPVGSPPSIRTNDHILDNDGNSDSLAGVHYGDRHEYTNWDAPPRTFLSSSSPVLGYGSAIRLGLGHRTLEPMGMIERMIAQNGSRWPENTMARPPAQLTAPTAPQFRPPPPALPIQPATALPQSDPTTLSDFTTLFEDDFIPVDAQHADPRVHNETLETHIRLLQTENASQRQVIETLRQEVESMPRAQRTHLGRPASQAISAATARTEAVEVPAPSIQSATPDPEHANARDFGQCPSIPSVPTMAFNDESVDLTQHLDSVRVHTQALERHMQLGQDILRNQIDRLLLQIGRLERRLRRREGTEVGRLMARIERVEEDAERHRTGKWPEGTGLWTRPDIHASPQPPGQRVAIRTPVDAHPRISTSSPASSECPTPPSSTRTQDIHSRRNQFLELTQPRNYPLDPRIAVSPSISATPDGRQTLITEYYHPDEAFSPRSRTSDPVPLEQYVTDFDDLYAPASPISQAAGFEPPREDAMDYTEQYQAASPIAGDPVRGGRSTFSPRAASFRPDAAGHNIRARAGLQPTELQGEPSPLQLDGSLEPISGAQLPSQDEPMAELAENASAAGLHALFADSHDESKPETARILPGIDADEPSPLSLVATVASRDYLSDVLDAPAVTMLDPRMQSIPASVRTASFSQRVPIIPSDTQERRQRRKRSKNAAALAK